jgi:hypothetical protein
MLPLPSRLFVPAASGISQPVRSASSQQYFSLRTNQPPATSHQYSSLRTNQHQPSATSQPNRPSAYRLLPTGNNQLIVKRHKKKASDQLEKSVGGDRFSLALEVEKLVLLSSLLESWQPPLLL